MTHTTTPLRSIPPSIWALGFVSMLMDISSEMIHSLLPLFMVGTLGASALTIGLIEGLIGSEAMGVSLGAGTTVMAAVATGAMVAVHVGAAVAMGLALARHVQPPSSAMMVSTVPRKIRILFRFKGHTSFFK